ncbi:MBL fold metallo-hydrolase [bacterium]|nr:MBL fold metallo-hydrolase [bacterium]
MGLVFEAMLTEGLASVSYLVGDTGSGTAALIDPSIDVDRYLKKAHDRRVVITHVFETHLACDQLSGSQLIPGAKVCLSWKGDYRFPHLPVHDGDRFRFGDLTLVARHTPGTSPEHMAYLLEENGVNWAVLSGDSLLVQSVGQPEDCQQLFKTLRDFYLKLDDGVLVYPAHIAGSACGQGMSRRQVSSIGYERRHNPYLIEPGPVDFQNYPARPAYFSRLKHLNGEAPPQPGQPQPLTAQAFQQALEEEDTQLVDTRDMFAFGAGHIAGALNLGAAPVMSLWAGHFLDPEKRLLLVLEEHERENVLRYLRRTGLAQFAGYLEGGMSKWSNAGLPLQQIPQRSVQQLREAGNNLQLIDVRSSAEYERGYIPGCIHIPLPRLQDQMHRLNPEVATAVYCGAGYRASLASSLLRRQGFKNVNNIPGSWKAWREAGYPVAGRTQDTVCVASPLLHIPKISLKPALT